MTYSADSGRFRSQLIWICPVCKGKVYLGSAELGLNEIFLLERKQTDKIIGLSGLWQLFLNIYFDLFQALRYS